MRKTIDISWEDFNKHCEFFSDYLRYYPKASFLGMHGNQDYCQEVNRVLRVITKFEKSNADIDKQILIYFALEHMAYLADMLGGHDMVYNSLAAIIGMAIQKDGIKFIDVFSDGKLYPQFDGYKIDKHIFSRSLEHAQFAIDNALVLHELDKLLNATGCRRKSMRVFGLSLTEVLSCEEPFLNIFNDVSYTSRLWLWAGFSSKQDIRKDCVGDILAHIDVIGRMSKIPEFIRVAFFIDYLLSIDLNGLIKKLSQTDILVTNIITVICLVAHVKPEQISYESLSGDLVNRMKNDIIRSINGLYDHEWNQLEAGANDKKVAVRIELDEIVAEEKSEAEPAAQVEARRNDVTLAALAKCKIPKKYMHVDIVKGPQGLMPAGRGTALPGFTSCIVRKPNRYYNVLDYYIKTSRQLVVSELYSDRQKKIMSLLMLSHLYKLWQRAYRSRNEIADHIKKLLLNVLPDTEDVANYIKQTYSKLEDSDKHFYMIAENAYQYHAVDKDAAAVNLKVGLNKLYCMTAARPQLQYQIFMLIGALNDLFGGAEYVSKASLDEAKILVLDTLQCIVNKEREHIPVELSKQFDSLLQDSKFGDVDVTTKLVMKNDLTSVLRITLLLYRLTYLSESHSELQKQFAALHMLANKLLDLADFDGVNQLRFQASIVFIYDTLYELSCSEKHALNRNRLDAIVSLVMQILDENCRCLTVRNGFFEKIEGDEGLHAEKVREAFVRFRKQSVTQQELRYVQLCCIGVIEPLGCPPASKLLEIVVGCVAASIDEGRVDVFPSVAASTFGVNDVLPRLHELHDRLVTANLPDSVAMLIIAQALHEVGERSTGMIRKVCLGYMTLTLEGVAHYLNKIGKYDYYPAKRLKSSIASALIQQKLDEINTDPGLQRLFAEFHGHDNLPKTTFGGL